MILVIMIRGYSDSDVGDERGKSEREIQQLLDTVSVNVVVPMVVSKVTVPNLRKAHDAPVRHEGR